MKVALGLCLDVLTLGGLGAAVYGVSLLSVPAAFIVGGGAAAAIGVLGARRNAKP